MISALSVLFLGFFASADFCEGLKSIDLQGTVVQEVHRQGQVSTTESSSFALDQEPYAFKNIGRVLQNIINSGTEILSPVFSSSAGAWLAVKDKKVLKDCVMVFIPVNERQWPMLLGVVSLNENEIKLRFADTQTFILLKVTR